MSDSWDFLDEYSADRLREQGSITKRVAKRKRKDILMDRVHLWFGGDPPLEENSMTMSATARKAIDKLMDYEGRYSNLPDDRGGPTMWGIASNFNPDLREDIINQRLTRDRARERYFTRYWRGIAGIDSLHPSVAYVLFNGRVHGITFSRVAGLAQQLAGLQPGAWGPRSAAHVAKWNSHQVSRYLSEIEQRARVMGVEIAEAARSPYKNGFVNRLLHAARDARSLA